MESAQKLGLEAIYKYFHDSPYCLTKHHLDSYNSFITNKLPIIIQSMNPIEVIKTNKNDTKKILHKIQVYIGNESGTEIFFDKPLIVDPQAKLPKRLLFPNEARMFNHTYSSDLYANILIRHVLNENESKAETKVYKNVQIGSIPIMLHSKLCSLENLDQEMLKEVGECIYDKGGYFIVDGKEKVIIAQERAVTNTLFLNKSSDDKYQYEGLIRCTSEKSSVFPKTIGFKILSNNIARGARRNAITVTVPHIDSEIPLFILFRALGVESDLDIIEHILMKEKQHWNDSDIEFVSFLRASVIDSNFIFDQYYAATYLSQYVTFKTIEHVYYILSQNLFPNIDQGTNQMKAAYLGNVCNTIIKTYMGMINETNRDNYMFKRIGISGFMISDIFKDFYNKFRVETRNRIDRAYEHRDLHTLVNTSIADKLGNVLEFFNSTIISQGMIKSLKGSWGLAGKEGVVQDLSRISYQGFLSHLRRINTPMDSSIKLRAPHQLHASHYGVVCPFESPDGGSIGLTKNMAATCYISFDVMSDVIFEALEPFKLKRIGTFSMSSVSHYVQIFINHNWVGIIDDKDAEVIVKWIRLLRRTGCLNPYISIAWSVHQKKINILTDNGRCVRPLLIVEHNQLLLAKKDITWFKKASWNTLVTGTFFNETSKIVNDQIVSQYINPFKKLGKETKDINQVIEILHKASSVIEYVDVEEVNTLLIAMRPNSLLENDYTHCELHPSVMFSIYTLSIPFTNHNPPTRIVFSGAQGKQAIGIYATNFNNRIDTMSYVLHYPQKPLVKTRFCDYVNATDMPNGQNLIVAIMTYTGYNQEDSIIVNKGSIDRGMFNLTYFKCHTSSEEPESQSSSEKVIFANKNVLLSKGIAVKAKYAKYTSMDDNGFPIEGSFIQQNDAIVGRFVVSKTVPTGIAIELQNIDNTSLTYTDKSDIADKTMEGVVDKVVVFVNKNGVREVKIRMRKFRVPELGDKMASRFGQKGVCGLILPPEDMPFTSSGIVPDIIINPHAFPSRMTVGHLMECVLSKACALEGCEYDAIPFENHDMEYWYNILESKYNMHRYGDEFLHNGKMGGLIKTQILIGPTYYFRLKHMVADKINYRTSGKVTGLTKQPTKGRSNQGGLRIGEMETNCLLGHGISSFIKESFIERSDKYEVYVDQTTGDIGAEKSRYNPRLLTPYAFKLLMQEIQSMSIMPRIQLEGDIDHEDNVDDELVYYYESDNSSEQEINS